MDPGLKKINTSAMMPQTCVTCSLKTTSETVDADQSIQNWWDHISEILRIHQWLH